MLGWPYGELRSFDFTAVCCITVIQSQGYYYWSDGPKLRRGGGGGLILVRQLLSTYAQMTCRKITIDLWQRNASYKYFAGLRLFSAQKRVPHQEVQYIPAPASPPMLMCRGLQVGHGAPLAFLKSPAGISFSPPYIFNEIITNKNRWTGAFFNLIFQIYNCLQYQSTHINVLADLQSKSTIFSFNSIIAIHFNKAILLLFF